MSSPISQKPPAGTEPPGPRTGDELPAVSEPPARNGDPAEAEAADQHDRELEQEPEQDQEQSQDPEVEDPGETKAPITGTERTHLSKPLPGSPGISGTEQTHLADPSTTGPMMPGMSGARTAQTKASAPETQAAKPIPRYCFSCGADLGEDRSTCKACGKRQRDPLVGKVLEDRYEVVRRLGEGAMGAVYEVRHLRLNKPFAMKVIHAELAQVAEFVARFEREALSCSRLAHPNCISVTDFGRASSGELFLVMEYVQGKSLDDLLRKKPLPVGHALDVTRQVLLGLQHAHQAGIIHRDIKPENVMLVEDTGEWRVKILDFGIAKVPVGDQHGGQLTQAGVVFGTPDYMAPEQALSTGVDARADLYSTGVMLWRMLTARPLFAGEGPVEILSAKLSTAAPSLESVIPGVYSQSLEEFVDRALQRKPSARFPDAQQMLDGLERIQGEIGRGLAVRPRLSGVTSLWNRTAQLAATTRRVFVDWYLCTEDAAPATWKDRLRGLATTTRGRIVLVLSLVALGLIMLVPAALLSTDPKKTPVGGAPESESWVKRAFKQAVMPDEKKKPPTDEDLPEEIRERLTKVRMFMAKGHCREASLDLKNLVAERPKLPQGHYLLGAAMVCRRMYKEGFDRYARAIELDSRYRADARILEDAQRLMKSKRARSQDRIAAVNFLGTKVGQPALPVLVEMANEHKNRHLRKHALALVVWLGAKDRIDWIATLSLDLEQLPKCKDRAEVVAKLRALGDPRALKALRKARDARTGIFRHRRKNYCCRKQIIAAIKELLEK